MNKLSVNDLHYQIHLLRRELNNNPMPKEVRADYQAKLHLAIARLQETSPRQMAFNCQAHYHRNVEECDRTGCF